MKVVSASFFFSSWWKLKLKSWNYSPALVENVLFFLPCHKMLNVVHWVPLMYTPHVESVLWRFNAYTLLSLCHVLSETPNAVVITVRSARSPVYKCRYHSTSVLWFVWRQIEVKASTNKNTGHLFMFFSETCCDWHGVDSEWNKPRSCCRCRVQTADAVF